MSKNFLGAFTYRTNVRVMPEGKVYRAVFPIDMIGHYYRGHQFFVHRSLYQRENWKWVVTENSTGFSVGPPRRTRKEAIDCALAILEQTNEKRWKEVIDNALRYTRKTEEAA